MKFLLVFILCTIVTLLWGQKSAVIRCQTNPEEFTEICLYKVKDGQKVMIGKGIPEATGRFGFEFVPPYEGFYVVGDEKGRLCYPVYLKPGDQASLKLGKEAAVLEGKNTPENKLFYEWRAIADPIEFKAVKFMLSHSTYKDFFPDFETFIQHANDFKAGIKTKNARFNELLKRNIDFEKDYYALIFIYTPRQMHPQKAERPAYYTTIISPEKFQDDMVMNMPYGASLLRLYTMFANVESPDASNPENKLKYVAHPRLKGELILEDMGRYRSYDVYKKTMDQYVSVFTPEQKQRAELIGSKLYETSVGMAAADFTYPDVNGKEVSLSDFKGKVVLVDVWATWCGPCRGEIPHLKKLEQEMHATDVVFIGVSVDEARDKQKWLDFIQKEGLGGVQLLASGWSKITKDYKIKGIPRFLVFDRKGNIVSVDAPRPSSPELKKMLEAELKK